MSKADRTRQRIIERSADLFNQKGFAGTSMSDIMAATGLTKGAIYGHFNGKEAIAVAAFDYAVFTVLDELRNRIAAAPTAPAKLDAVLDYYRAYVFAPPVAGGCPILNTAVEADDSMPALRKRVALTLDMLHASLTKILRTGIAREQIRADVDVEQFATLFIALVEGAIMMARISGDIAPMDTVVERLRGMIAEELLPESLAV